MLKNPLSHAGAPRPMKTLLALLAGLLILAGCATAGRDFDEHQVSRIRIGVSTQDDIRNLFGSPWRVGVEDGKTTWTYGLYKYRLIGEGGTKDLLVRFNDDNTVSSYTFNTTDHGE